MVAASPIRNANANGVWIAATPGEPRTCSTRWSKNVSRSCHLNGSRVCTHDLVRLVTDRLLNRGQDTRNAAPLRMGVRPRFVTFHFSPFTFHALGEPRSTVPHAPSVDS